METPPATSARVGRADIHMHTSASDGLISPRQLLDRIEELELDVIAVTDHDTVDGAIAVRDLARERDSRIDVIVGIEVTTTRGMHLLGLFVEESIRTFQSVEYTIEAIIAQGGVPLAPHPMSPLTPSLGRRTIERLLHKGYPLAGMETMNPTPAGKITRQRVQEWNRQWNLAEFGGSDAHFRQHVGAAYTTFPGQDGADLRRALLEHTTVAHLSTDPIPFVHPVEYARQFRRSMIEVPVGKLARRFRAPAALPQSR